MFLRFAHVLHFVQRLLLLLPQLVHQLLLVPLQRLLLLVPLHLLQSFAVQLVHLLLLVQLQLVHLQQPLLVLPPQPPQHQLLPLPPQPLPLYQPLSLQPLQLHAQQLKLYHLPNAHLHQPLILPLHLLQPCLRLPSPLHLLQPCLLQPWLIPHVCFDILNHKLVVVVRQLVFGC